MAGERRSDFRLGLTSFALLAALVAAPSRGAAALHEEGVLHAPRRATAGSEFEVRGSGLPRATVLRLRLRGALGELPVAEVRTDPAGRFSARVRLPDAVRPASYTLLALAPDGDVVGRTDLAVTAAAEAAPPVHLGHAEPDTAPAPPAHPTAARMHLPTATTPSEWAAILALLGAAAAAGFALLRPRARR